MANDFELPEVFYVFVNEGLPIAFHNVRRIGRIASGTVGGWGDRDFLAKYLANEVDWLPFLPNPSVSPWLSVYSAGLIAGYAVEYDAEICRRSEFGSMPSRLSAVFAFGDEESCSRAAELYRWPLDQVQRFRLVEHPLNRVARVNMEVVSLARMAYRVSALDSEASLPLWRSYWSGMGSVSADLPGIDLKGRRVVESGIVWEYLIEGALELLQSP